MKKTNLILTLLLLFTTVIIVPSCGGDDPVDETEEEQEEEGAGGVTGTPTENIDNPTDDATFEGETFFILEKKRVKTSTALNWTIDIGNELQGATERHTIIFNFEGDDWQNIEYKIGTTARARFLEDEDANSEVAAKSGTVSIHNEDQKTMTFDITLDDDRKVSGTVSL